jgi:hypothetical protein
MTPANNPFNSSSSLPALNAIQRRHREMLAFQAWQRSPQATESLAEEEPRMEEESSLAPNPDEPNDTCGPEDPPHAEDSELAPDLQPLRRSRPGLGLAGLDAGN